MPNYNIAPWPAQANSYDGISNIALNGWAEQYPLSLYQVSLATPTISATAGGDGNVLLTITNGNSSYRYLVYIDGVGVGFFKSIDNQIVISNLPFTVPHTIRIRSTYATYSGNTLTTAGLSQLSNSVTVTPQFQFAARVPLNLRQPYNGGVGQYDQPPYDYIDIIRLPSLLYSTSDWEHTNNTYTDQEAPGAYAIPLSPSFKISIYTAQIRLRARLVNGAKDETYFGAVDYSYKDVDVTVDDPFLDLYGADGHDIGYYYFQKLIELGLYQANISSNISSAIGWRLAKEYMLSKPYLGNKIKNIIKNNFNIIMKSREAMLQFRDITNFNPKLTKDFQDFTITYQGPIWINPKIISTSGTPDEVTIPANALLYNLKNSKNRILKSGNSPAAILLSNPQDCSHYSFSAIAAPLSPDDYYGNAPAS